MRQTSGLLGAGLLAAFVAVPQAWGQEPMRGRAVTVQTASTLAPNGAATVPVELDQQRARDVHNEFQKLMERYPPNLARILRLDPALMTSPGYLAPYPGLVAYLQRHPEIAKSPSYFLDFAGGDYYYQPQDPDSVARRDRINFVRDIMTGVMVVTIITIVALTLIWLLRTFIAHRRWLRATKIQADVHGRMLERLGAGEELLAYVQSPAAREFLQAVPTSADSMSSGTSAPIGRMLWSVQTGIVLVAAGIGLLTLKHYFTFEAADVLLVMGVLALALGIGFGLAAAVSYLLSHRLGLFDAQAGRARTSGGA